MDHRVGKSLNSLQGSSNIEFVSLLVLVKTIMVILYILLRSSSFCISLTVFGLSVLIMSYFLNEIL